MTVLQLIAECKSTAQKTEALRAECTRSDADLNTRIRETTERFDAFAADLQSHYRGIEQIISQLALLHAERIALRDGHLSLREKSQGYSAIAFDERTCASLLSRIKGEIVDNLKRVYVSPDLQTLEAICRQFNTLTDMVRSKALLREKTLSQIRSQANSALCEKQAECAALEKRLKQLKQELAAHLKQSRPSAPVIDSRFAVATGCPDPLSLPLASLSCERAGLTEKEYAGAVIDQSCWELSRNGILNIVTDRATLASDQILSHIKALTVRELGCYPALSKRLVFFDATDHAGLRLFVGEIAKASELLLIKDPHGGNIHVDEESFSSGLEELCKIINHRIDMLAGTKYNSIAEYNKSNADNLQPLIFVTVYGYPHGILPCADAFRRILKNGRRAGVFVCTVSLSDAQTDAWTLEKLPALADFQPLCCQASGDGTLCFAGECYDPDRISADFDMHAFLKQFSEQTVMEEGFVHIDSILPKERFSASRRRQDYSKLLSIPVGKSGNRILELKLDAEGDAHAVICGASGSGKSSLINTIILSAASLYSPEELEIHIIQMTKSEMKIYPEHRLPHLRSVISEDDVMGANDVLDYLYADLQERNRIIGSKGNIVRYNAGATDGEKLSRSLVIVDEYQVLTEDDKARERLISLAALSRSAGMSLILSSQSVPPGFGSALTNLRHKFEFKSQAAGALVQEASYRKSELEALKGNCLYSQNDGGGGAELVRIAFWNESANEPEVLIDRIAAAYPNVKMHIDNEICIKTVNDTAEIPYLSKKPKREYNDDGICRVRLGLEYMKNTPVEYPFGYKNGILCIFGEYLLTKEIELSLIKDFLHLSVGCEGPTVIYADLNRNPNRRRKETVLRRRIDQLTGNTEGRFAYFGADFFTDAVDQVKDILYERENSEEAEIAPLLVLINSAERISEEDDEMNADAILSMLGRAKDSNVFFAFQFNEFDPASDAAVAHALRICDNAIIVPDRAYEGEVYSSAAMQSFLEYTAAADTGAKELIKRLSRHALDPHLHLLCTNNRVTLFTPYRYTDAFYDRLPI